MIMNLFSKPVLIFGCGNVLLGDDGFGPAVIEYLQKHHQLPDSAMSLDVGTSIRNILFDILLLPTKPRKIFIIDAVQQEERRPGELFELDLQQIPAQKVSDFSLHQFPSVNLLKEFTEEGRVEIRILAVQIKEIPAQVEPGLSDEVQKALPKACLWLLQQIKGIS
jgi:coenzyme F420 hydrogenase subunit delta